MVSATPALSRKHRRIGKYVVTGRIGRGGMGMVYRGYDEVLERDVAVKTLTVEGTLDEESRKRFEIEAKAAAKLQHPNILTVFELGEDRGMPFIAMELLPGADLEAVLRSGEPLPLHEKLDIVIQVLRGLAYAHEHRIVHRDIKPSNVRLLDDGTAKIMDFGIAKLGGTGVTKSGMMVGTLHYMSPEQIRGQPLDGRSDVFSVGVILFELLAGRRPFSGDAPTAVLYKIIHDPAPALLGSVADCSPRLQEILDKALAKDPDARYAGAAPLADDLSALLAARMRELGAEAAAPEELAAARKLLKDGRLEQVVARCEALVEAHPHALEVRRTLRMAKRELLARKRPKEPEADEFPELDATFEASPTRRSPETLVQPPTVVGGAGGTATAQAQGAAAAGRHPAAPGRGLLYAAGAFVAAAVIAGAVLLLGGGESQPARLKVRSRPGGAAVLVDGKQAGTTDAELEVPAGAGRFVVTLRKAGYHDETRTVTLPLPEAGLEVTLRPLAAPLPPPVTAVKVPLVSDPPGATVTLDGQRVGTAPLEVSLEPAAEHRLGFALEGFASQETRIGAGAVPKQVHVSLAPLAPPGTVSVVSAYPVDVLWRGQSLGKGPTLTVPSGRQALTLVSNTYFLRLNVTVDVKAGATTAVEAPRLGKISIRANPDNCRVLIDGTFVDYPPILDRAIAAGSHRVSFQWPDGVKRDEERDVPAGGLVFVTGRKD